jgi:sialate O-acetylesterase
MRWKSWLVGVVLSALVPIQGPAVFAAVKPHPLISDGMVLQQGMKVPIWGKADEGEKVTVRIQDQEATATAKDGKWIVRLDHLKPGGPFEMTIHGTNTLQLKNVYVGEVWICSGQSNMEWPLRFTTGAEKAIAESRNPLLRLFTVPHKTARMPLETVSGHWQEAAPETVPGFSAVAYYFGRDVQKALKVPVGLIHTSWGGTPAESWTSAPALEGEPSLKYLAERKAHAWTDYLKSFEKSVGVLQKYEETLKKAIAEKHEPPAPPSLPQYPGSNPWIPTSLYNGMIASIIPYGMRGAIWYQGESNAGRAYEYRTLLATMIKDWRQDWGEGDFPFLIVQLAPFMKIETEPKESQWAELREAQLLTALRVPNVGLAVITDVGNETDIHPKQKEPVGARLALAARALAYGDKIVYSGPIYQEMKVEGDRAILSFQHVGGGLVAKSGPLTGFTIAGPDHKFVKAEAEIRDGKVVVWSPHVKPPVAVRYGWANYPTGNLWNQEGLPASPFRTDDFPMLTQPKNRPSAASSSLR